MIATDNSGNAAPRRANASTAGIAARPPEG
jgi:hypothetical protein